MAIKIMDLKFALMQFTKGQVFSQCLDGYSMDKRFLETEGDIDEAFEIVKEHIKWLTSRSIDTGDSPLQRLGWMWEFINCAQNVSTPSELLSIAIIKEFKNKYPALYETMCIWAWG